MTPSSGWVANKLHSLTWGELEPEEIMSINLADMNKSMDDSRMLPQSNTNKRRANTSIHKPQANDDSHIPFLRIPKGICHGFNLNKSCKISPCDQKHICAKCNMSNHPMSKCFRGVTGQTPNQGSQGSQGGQTSNK